MAEVEKAGDSGGADKGEAAKVRRSIPGNFAYMTNYGSIKKVLEKIVQASKPDKFSQDFLATVLKLSGGSYRPVIPVLKRIGFLTGDGSPTEIYSKFRTDSGRHEAVYYALKNGFSELFKRNEHVYAASDSKLTDLIVEVTGLPKDDSIVGAVRGTFKVFSSYLPANFSVADLGGSATSDSENDHKEPEERPMKVSGMDQEIRGLPIGLAYNINVILPETKDIEVYNVIFRSLRDNLLRL